MDFRRNVASPLHSKDKTYVYLWTYRQFQQEQAEWDCLNKLLQNHGFKPVNFADPVENTSLPDLVLLDKRSAAEVRATVKTMLGDSERRQALIQELIQSNNLLKEEAQDLIGQAGRHSQRASELEGLLNGVRGQVQDLEERCLAQAVQQRGHAHRLQQDALDTQSRCQALELQLTNERERRGQLELQLTNEMERRGQLELQLTNERETWGQLELQLTNEREARGRLELQLTNEREARGRLELQLTNEREARGRLELQLTNEREARGQLELQLTNEREARSRLELQLTNEREAWGRLELQLTNEREARGQLELQLTNERKALGQLERQLTNEREARGQLQRKLCFAVREEERRVARQTLAFQRVHQHSAHQDAPADQQVLDVIDFYETQMAQLQEDMPRSFGGVPEGSQASNASSGETTSGDVTSSFKAALTAQLEDSKVQREELRAEVHTLQQELETRPTLKDMKAYKHRLRLMERWIQRSSNRQRPPVGQSELPEFDGLRPALEAWANQLAMLTELHAALRRLSQRLTPWRPADDGRVAAEAVRVEDLMLLVDTLLEDTEAEHDNALVSPTRHTLLCMVAHFQKLFDVGSLNGVYPRMNHLYARLGQTDNAMTSLRDILDLDNKAPPSQVVSRVASMASSTAADSPRVQFHRLLAEGDIDRLMQTLEVDRLDHILPALTSLKLKSPR
ncbi:hypothetical protein NHX12_014565 [Muraenolepis orangiensis]|uniref:Centrosomal protein of 70 kDa n=1 Tax=Muraenolepis orangiensis TaxID=630683 RepID=A0A9Q0D8X4_9TELE|nr:hypothetical protein NHX12_014565 [Muraenolepis orangiensis]